MSWNSVGRVQKWANYDNKHNRGRTAESKCKKKFKDQEVKEYRADTDVRVMDVAFHLIVLGHIQAQR